MKYRKAALVVGGLLLAVWLAPLGRAHEINPSIRLDGAPLMMDVPATIDLSVGRTLAPIRHMAEALGYLVDWDAESKTAFVERDGHYIAFEIGSKDAVVDGETVAMGVAPRMVRGRVLVPLRFFAEMAGANVAWDEATMSIDLTSPTSALARPAFGTEGATFGTKAVDMWRSLVAMDSPTLPTVLVDEGLVFTPGGRELTALNRENGQVVWTVPLADSSTPVYDAARGMLYVASGSWESTRLYGLEAATGNVVWFAAISGNQYGAPQPVLVGSKVLVNANEGGHEGTLIAFDADNGSKLWQAPARGKSTPVAFGARMFVTDEVGGVAAYRTIDGRPLWQYQSSMSDRDAGQKHLLIDQGRVYVSAGQAVTALDEATGRRLWLARDLNSAGALASDGAQVWVTVRDGLTVLDAATGELLRYPAICGMSPSAPVVSKTHAFITCDGTIYAIDQKNFAVSEVGKGRGPLTLDGDRLYYTRSQMLAALMAMPG